MKNLHLIGLFALMCLFFTACEDDPIGGGGGTEIGPSALLLAEEGFVSVDTELPANSIFSVKLDATQGDNALNAVTVQEDGITLDNSRITVNGSVPAANPMLVVGDDTNGFTWEISVDAQNAEGESKVYDFIVQDINMNSDTESILISTETVVGSMPPGLTIDGPTDYFANSGSSAAVNLVAATGSADLYSLFVLVTDENGDFNAVTDLSTLFFGELTNNFDSNPYILGADDKDGFAKQLYIKPDYVGVASYRIVLEDENGNSVSEDINMESGTSFTQFHEGVLFNAGGPSGTGGLDLDDPDSGTSGVGSMDSRAEIRDAGIDSSQPNADNWRRRIGGINGTELKKVNSVLPEGIGFADLNLTEYVAAFFDASDEVLVDINGGVYSSIVEEGDIFAVRGATKDYFIHVKEVNVKTDDNSDNYILDVKF